MEYIIAGLAVAVCLLFVGAWCVGNDVKNETE